MVEAPGVEPSKRHDENINCDAGLSLQLRELQEVLHPVSSHPVPFRPAHVPPVMAKQMAKRPEVTTHAPSVEVPLSPKYWRQVVSALTSERREIITLILLARWLLPITTRDERAHRRQTWKIRFERNQRSPEVGCCFNIDGVPSALDDLLGIPRELPRAA